jgi:hypothetical protein
MLNRGYRDRSEIPYEFRGARGRLFYIPGAYDDYLEITLPEDPRAAEKLLRSLRSIPKKGRHGEYEIKFYEAQPRIVSIMRLYYDDAMMWARQTSPEDRLREILDEIRRVAPALNLQGVPMAG